MDELRRSKRETDYAVARRRMVSELAARGLADERVLLAMESLPRHHFLDAALGGKAYEHSALPIGFRQTLTHPETTARVTGALELAGTESVLEIGTGSGYQTALLASLAGEVWTVERIEALHVRAKAILFSLGYTNIHFHLGDGSLGRVEGAPFDRVLSTAACGGPPAVLLAQLAEDGVMVYPRGEGRAQELIRCRKRRGAVLEASLGPCLFVPLVADVPGADARGRWGP